MTGNKFLARVAVAAAFAMTATACGGTSSLDPGTTDPTESDGPVEPTAEPAAAAGEVTVSDAMGQTTLDEPATTVVALEWEYVEGLLALGVEPVGIADPEGYRKWVTTPVPLPDGTPDVGTRQEPSLEAIAGLRPDLIIGLRLRHEAILPELQAIAPTLLFDPYVDDPNLNQHDLMIDAFTNIAAATGRTEQAEDVLDRMEGAFAAARAALESSGNGGAEVLLAQAYTSEGAPVMRMFLRTSMAGHQLSLLGLENAWVGEYQSGGTNRVGVEALAEVEHVDFLHATQEDDEVFTSALRDHPVWKNLQFVQEDRIYPIGGDLWLFGGPLSAIRFVESVSEQMAR